MSKAEQQTSDQDKAVETKMPSKVIKQHVAMALGGGLIPVPYADMAAVTAVQIKILIHFYQPLPKGCGLVYKRHHLYVSQSVSQLIVL